MTNPTVLSLASRITGLPDRGLDAEIALATGWNPWSVPDWEHKPWSQQGWAWPYFAESALRAGWAPMAEVADFWCVPAFTAQAGIAEALRASAGVG